MGRIGVRVAAFAGVGLLAMVCSAGARAQVKLDARFPEGKTLRYRTRTSINQVVKNLGMEMPGSMDRTVICTEAIGKRQGDSSLPVAVKVESFRERLRLPGGVNVSYDSKDAAAKVDTPDLDFFNDLYKLAGQVAYTVVLDGKNKVKAIEGADALRERVDRLDPRAGALLRSRLAADTLKAEFEQALGALPDGPARPGEPWERTEVVDIGGGMELVVRKKYEYAGTEKRGGKDLDKITAKVVEVKYRQDDDSSSPLKLTKSDMKVNSSEATILFDREAGCIVESHERIEMKGSVTLSIEGQDQQCGFDLTMRTDVQLQR